MRHDRLNDVFWPALQLSQGAVLALSWQWERRKQRASTHRDCGQTVLFPDRQELEARRSVAASRHHARVEARCRLSTSRRLGRWWPASPWTESTRYVHALSCLLALLRIRMVVLRLQERPLSLGGDFLMARLHGIVEALGV